METEYWSDEMPFVNEECGDTMWNEENLNPPSGNAGKLVILERMKVENEQSPSLPLVSKSMEAAALHSEIKS